MLLVSFIGSAIGFCALSRVAAQSATRYSDYLSAERDATPANQLAPMGAAATEADGDWETFWSPSRCQRLVASEALR